MIYQSDAIYPNVNRELHKKHHLLRLTKFLFISTCQYEADIHSVNINIRRKVTDPTVRLPSDIQITIVLKKVKVK
jgi:hypothetical protein